MTGTCRDMFAVFSVTLLCLMSVSRAAPLACEDLVRPLDQLDHHNLLGGWALVADSGIPLATANVHSSLAMYFSNTSETSVYSFTQSSSNDDRCAHVSSNITIENGTFTGIIDIFFNISGSFLYTSCPDCLVTRWVMDRGAEDLLMFSRRREVEQEYIEEFKAQMECLKMPPPNVMDPTKKLCPEETSSDPAAETGEKTEGQTA